jgi:Putative zinc-finger
MMHCSDVEILLAEYVDGTLRGDAKAALESHLLLCEGCRELAQDAAATVAFLSRTASIEPPPELVTKILFQIPAVKPSLARRLFGSVLGGWLEPVLQPRLAMGMGAAALSFFMLEPKVHQLTPSDLDPVKVWTFAENRVNRAWERGVKSYQNVRLVYEIQTRLTEWQSEAPEAQDQQPAEAIQPARQDNQ